MNKIYDSIHIDHIIGMSEQKFNGAQEARAIIDQLATACKGKFEEVARIKAVMVA